jgi:hypothetical protein
MQAGLICSAVGSHLFCRRAHKVAGYELKPRQHPQQRRVLGVQGVLELGGGQAAVLTYPPRAALLVCLLLLVRVMLA